MLNQSSVIIENSISYLPQLLLTLFSIIVAYFIQRYFDFCRSYALLIDELAENYLLITNGFSLSLENAKEKWLNGKRGIWIQKKDVWIHPISYYYRFFPNNLYSRSLITR